MATSVLVTGSSGYIGSHACLALCAAGHKVVGLDDLSRGNAQAEVVLSNKFGSSFVPNRGDIADRTLVGKLCREHGVTAVMHFAAKAYVGESVEQPLLYHDVNTGGAIALLSAARKAGVSRFIFSSTCATYGEVPPDRIPINEAQAQNPINPYGRSKLAFEHVLFDEVAAAAATGKDFAVGALRYFNVAGSDPTGVVGEYHAPETHLIPIILGCLAKVRPDLDNMVPVLGGSYPTPDGTPIRDYVHVSDLIRAHEMVLAALKPGQKMVFNVGTGVGWSVRQVIAACEKVTGLPVPLAIRPARAGDPAKLLADATAIRAATGWVPEYPDLHDAIAHAWKWMQANPPGRWNPTA